MWDLSRTSSSRITHSFCLLMGYVMHALTVYSISFLKKIMRNIWCRVRLHWIRKTPTMFERRKQAFNRLTVYDMRATRKYSKNNKKSGSNRSSAGRTPPRKANQRKYAKKPGKNGHEKNGRTGEEQEKTTPVAGWSIWGAIWRLGVSPCFEFSPTCHCHWTCPESAYRWQRWLVQQASQSQS